MTRGRVEEVTAEELCGVAHGELGDLEALADLVRLAARRLAEEPGGGGR
jgi:hypothetical protein